MFEFGVGMTRQKLKRQHPQDTTEQIEARVRKWLQSMPNTAAE